MEPIELLKQELDKWKNALQKSDDAFEFDLIDYKTHETHYNNLQSKIAKYELAIKILKSNI